MPKKASNFLLHQFGIQNLILYITIRLKAQSNKKWVCDNRAPVEIYLLILQTQNTFFVYIERKRYERIQILLDDKYYYTKLK